VKNFQNVPPLLFIGKLKDLANVVA